MEPTTKVDSTVTKEKHPAQENPQKTFRLHVSGLGPTILPQDLERRFSSFGSVLKVDGVGKLDANGCPLHYAFIDILSTDLQVKRCMNLLSGTTYKGNTLRIAPSRPDYIARASRERENLPTNTFIDPDEAVIREREEKAALKRKRKYAKIRARRRGVQGYQSVNMELMTVQRFKSRQGVNGWKKDPETSLPIFPIITRPPRPLPSLDLIQTQGSDSQEPSQANDSKEPSQGTDSKEPSQGTDSKEPSRLVRVPTRARRVRIDPTLYRAAIKHRKTHIVGPRAISIEQYKLGFISGANKFKKSQITRPMWNCRLSEDGHIIWSLQTDDGVQEERVQLSHSTPDPYVAASSGSTSSSPLRLRGGSAVQTKSHRDTKSDVQLSNLTDMFKAKEDEKKGFSLNDALEGMELDQNILAMPHNPDNEVTTVTPSLAPEKVQEGKRSHSKAFIHPSRLNGTSLPASQATSSVKPSEKKRTFFFYPTDEDPDSRMINSLLSPERRESARKGWLSQDPPSSSNSWRTFLATESMSQIESKHNQKKSELTEHMRRRHKDALKQERKRGIKLMEI